MSNEFRGVGNLGAAPTLKTGIEVDGEPRSVANMRIFFDRPVKTDDGFEDKGGFWLDVDLWGKRAERAAKLLPKGARVVATGSLEMQTWSDKESGLEEQSKLVLHANRVSLDLSRVDKIVLHKKGERQQVDVTDEGHVD